MALLLPGGKATPAQLAENSPIPYCNWVMARFVGGALSSVLHVCFNGASQERRGNSLKMLGRNGKKDVETERVGLEIEPASGREQGKKLPQAHAPE